MTAGRPALPPASGTRRAAALCKKAAARAVMWLGLLLAAVISLPALAVLALGAGIWLATDWIAQKLGQ